MEGLQGLFHAIMDEGGEVIATDPGFVSHLSQVRFNGQVLVFWLMNEAKGWRLDRDAPLDLIGPKAKAILLVNLSNPTGAVLFRETFLAVAQIALANGVLVVLDDPYIHFVSDNRDRFFNLAFDPSFPDCMAKQDDSDVCPSLETLS